MGVPTYHLCLFPICILILSAVHSMEVCKQKSPCSCEFPNGTGIDLTPAAKPIYETIAYQKSKISEMLRTFTFYFHPCYDVQIDAGVEPDTASTCTDPLALCRHAIIWNGTVKDTLTRMWESYDYMGSSNDESMAPDGSYITYNNLPSQTIVHLICADTDGQLSIKDISDPKTLELQFFSRYACLRQLPIQGSYKGAQVSSSLWQPRTVNPTNWGLFQLNLGVNIF